MALNRDRSKSRFTYQRGDDDEIRKMARDSGRKYETPFKPGFDVFVPKTGTNNIRILQGTWAGARYYAYTIHVHRYVGTTPGTFLCLQEMGKGKCPCCEAKRAALEAGDEQEARAMSPSVQVVMWIINRNAEEDPPIPMLYAISKTRDAELVELSQDPDTNKLLTIDHPDNGYDISFKRQGTGLKDTKYMATTIARRATPIHDDPEVQESILEFIHKNPIPSVLRWRDYKFIDAAISGTAVEKDPDLDEPEEDADSYNATKKDEPKARPATKARQTRDEDEDEEDEAPARTPTRTARTSVKEDEPEDEPEEEDEDLPPARKPAKPERAARRGS